MKEINFTIEESAKGRLDKVIAENVADLTRSQVQNLIKKGQILVNDTPTTNRYQVKPNDQVIISPRVWLSILLPGTIMELW